MRKKEWNNRGEEDRVRVGGDWQVDISTLVWSDRDALVHTTFEDEQIYALPSCTHRS